MPQSASDLWHQYFVIISPSLYVIFVIFIYIHLFTLHTESPDYLLCLLSLYNWEGYLSGGDWHLFIHEIDCDVLYYVWCANKLNSNSSRLIVAQPSEHPENDGIQKEKEERVGFLVYSCHPQTVWIHSLIRVCITETFNLRQVKDSL